MGSRLFATCRNRILWGPSETSHLLTYAVFYLAPLSISFNLWFWSLVVTVLTQAAYIMGYYTGITSVDGCGRYWCGTNTIWKGEPFKWNVMADVGMVLGMFVIYFVLNRGYVVETLKAALGMLPSERVRDIEKKQDLLLDSL